MLSLKTLFVIAVSVWSTTVFAQGSGTSGGGDFGYTLNCARDAVSSLEPIIALTECGYNVNEALCITRNRSGHKRLSAILSDCSEIQTH